MPPSSLINNDLATKEMSSRLNLVALMGKNDGWKNEVQCARKCH